MLLTVTLPAYNESENIESFLLEIENFLQSIFKIKNEYNILVVNDGSTDNTHEILNELKKKIPDLSIITHDVNRGYRAAVQSCLENSSGDLVVVIDSDGQFKINDLPKFLEKANQGYELVIGNKIKRNDPYIRILLGKSYNLIFGLLFGVKFKEVDCGFRLLSKKLAKKIELGEGNLPIGPELAVTALTNDFKIAEVPVRHHQRKGGKTVFPLSKLPKIVFLSFYGLIKLKMKTKRKIYD